MHPCFLPIFTAIRRQRLKADIESGLILFLGNGDSPINAMDNCYAFRQDSSFLYFWGLDLPNLAAVIDVDTDTETVFGDDPSLDHVIWTGPQPSLSERCRGVGVYRSAPLGKLPGIVGAAMKTAAHGSFFTALPHGPDDADSRSLRSARQRRAWECVDNT